MQTIDHESFIKERVMTRPKPAMPFGRSIEPYEPEVLTPFFQLVAPQGMEHGVHANCASWQLVPARRVGQDPLTSGEFWSDNPDASARIANFLIAQLMCPTIVIRHLLNHDECFCSRNWRCIPYFDNACRETDALGSRRE